MSGAKRLLPSEQLAAASGVPQAAQAGLKFGVGFHRQVIAIVDDGTMPDLYRGGCEAMGKSCDKLAVVQ
jgi:hypothetical protein